MIYTKTLSAQILERNPDLHKEILSLSTYKMLRTKLNKITIEDNLYYIAEGDLLLDEDELEIYAMSSYLKRKLSEVESTPTLNNENQLLGIINNKRIVRWKPGYVITYCVLKATFPNDEHYKLVVKNMKKATTDWEQTCGVQFEHITNLDNSNSVRPEGVTFPVRGIDSSGQLIASAFFPTYPKHRWKILIDPSYFTTNFNKVGILRHELGHVLGFRHEHIKSGAPAACPDEDIESTINLTDYDPKSVMHYFCGEVGTTLLAISEVDKKGAQKVYGPPLGNFEFIG